MRWLLTENSLVSGKYSDFSIRCADDTIIHAHRAVVCPRSRVLAAALDGDFQVCYYYHLSLVVSFVPFFIFISNRCFHRLISE